METLKLEVGKLDLKEGNLLIVKINGRPEKAYIEGLRKHLKTFLPTGVRSLIIFGNDIEISVVREEPNARL